VSRLCRLMCGKALPCGSLRLTFRGCATSWGKAPKPFRRIRKGVAFPHIGRQSRKTMILILNQQRSKKINLKSWGEFAERALKAIRKKPAGATVVFVSDSAIRRLNRQFRGKDQASDVLSFPSRAEPFEIENRGQLGEVVISVQRAAAQAKQNGLTFSNEIEQLILHGLLHLCGYDHETDDGEMNRLELKLRKKLGI
jgi:probable rRNA maturation factor